MTSLNKAELQAAGFNAAADEWISKSVLQNAGFDDAATEWATESGLFPASKSLGSISYFDLYGIGNPWADNIVNVQDGMMYAQRKYYELRLNNTGLDDQFLEDCFVDFVVPFRLSVSNPIIIPEYVRLVLPMGVSLAGTLNATKVARYTGDPTSSKVLSNGCFPMVMLTHRAAISDTTLYCTNGSTGCSGLTWGKNWYPSAATPMANGTGYTVGDILTLPQPSKAPHYATQLKVETVNGTGGVTSVSFALDGNSNPIIGSYAMPSGAQARYWTVANGYTGTAGTIANTNRGNVFDSSGNYRCTGGTGTGATFALTWVDDFNGSGGDFRRGSGLQGDGWIGRLRIAHATKLDDPTWGKSFGFSGNGLQLYVDKIITDGGYYGIDIQITDFHANQLMPISARVPLSVRFCSSVQCPQVVIDTWDIHALQIDKVGGSNLTGRIFHNVTTSLGTVEPIQIGANTYAAADGSNGNRFTFDVSASGTASTVPAMYANYIKNSIIDINVVNTKADGTLLSPVLNYYGRFGSNFDSSNLLRGMFGPGCLGLSQAFPPSCGISVYDNIRGKNIEPVIPNSTNVIKSGRNFANTTSASTIGWVILSGTPTVTLGAAGPDGNLTACTTTFATSADAYRQQLTVAANTPIYIEAKVKYVSGNNVIWLGFGDASQTNRVKVAYYANGGTVFGTDVTGTGVLTRYGVSDIGNGYYKIWLIGTVGSANPYAMFLNNGGTTSVSITDYAVAINPKRYPPEFRPAITPVTVTTTAVGLGFCEYAAQRFLVNGVSGTKEFSDIITVSPGRAPITSHNDVGLNSPDTRSYTLDTTTDKGLIKLAMSAGSYTVTLIEMKQQ